jgi:hypothetical protein
VKCTDCKTLVPPVVALDIDGTLGQYHQHFIYFLDHYLGGAGIYPERWSGVGEFSDYLGLTKQEYREAKLAYRQGGWKRWMPPYAGAADLVASLHRQDVEVWLCTTRPWLRLDNIDPDTREWCRRYRIEFDGMLFGEDKYEQLLKRVDRSRIIAVVDDEQTQLDTLARLGLPLILRMHEFNGATHAMSAYSSLENLQAELCYRVKDWKAANGWR